MTKTLNELRKLPPVNHDNLIEIESRINDYFQYCIDNGLRPGVEGLATSLGVSRQTLLKWQEKGGMRGELIDQTKQAINAILEELALNNEINPATLIWLQKNHFGYKDSVTIEAERYNPLNDLPSKEEILKRLPDDYNENDC